MDFFYTVICMVIIVLISRFLVNSLTINSGQVLPPGPPRLPIIGNLHQLGLTPHRSLHHLAATYGPIMHLKLGTISTIVISSSHLAKQLLQTHDHLISSRYLSDTICIQNHHNVSVIFLPVCPKWRNLRKVIATEIFTQARLDDTQAFRLKSVEQLLEHVDENIGRAIDIGFVAFVTMINSLSNTLVSVDLVGYGSGSSTEFRELVMSSMEVAAKPNLSNFFPALRFLDLQGLRRKNDLNVTKTLSIINSFVDERVRSGYVSEVGSESDVLDTLLRKQVEYDLSLVEIRHLFLDMFVAGADTSSTTVEWAMTELLRNPDKMEKVRAEVSTAFAGERLIRESDILKLKYLQAVVKETLRLHPAAPFLIPHKAVTDVEVDGFMVPVGSQIFINVWSIGRDPKIWPNPELFEPERFLDLEIDYKGTHFTLIPFGAGRRICPGLNLAHRTVHVVLASLLHAYDWDLENGMKAEEIDMNDKFSLSVHKLQPLRVIPKPKHLT